MWMRPPKPNPNWVRVGGAGPFPSNREGERGKEGEGDGKRGAAPPPLVQFGLGQGGRASPHVACLLSSTTAH